MYVLDTHFLTLLIELYASDLHTLLLALSKKQQKLIFCNTGNFPPSTKIYINLVT